MLSRIGNAVAHRRWRVGDDNSSARRLIDGDVVGSAPGPKDRPAPRNGVEIIVQDPAAAEKPDDFSVARNGGKIRSGLTVIGCQVDPLESEPRPDPIRDWLPVEIDEGNLGALVCSILHRLGRV